LRANWHKGVVLHL